MKSRFLLFGLVTLFCFKALAQDSYIQKYRAESHKGLKSPLLNPLFPHDGKWEFSGGVSYSPYSTLMDYFAYSGSLTIHINRRHAIEPLYFSYNNAWLSRFTKNEVAAAAPNTAVEVELPRMRFIASYFFSPYYSKMSVSPQSTAHFDAYFGLGFGITKSREVFADASQGVDYSRPTGAFTMGMRFLMPSRWALRFELRDFLAKSNDFNQESLSHNLQMGASLSIFFGSFADLTNI